MAKVVCESRLSGQTQPVIENTASTVGAGNKARKLMESPPHFPTHVRQKIPAQKKKNTSKRIRCRRNKKTILTTGSVVKRQVLFPAAEIQARRRKKAGRFKAGGAGARDLG